MFVLGNVLPAPAIRCGKALAAKQARITCGPSRATQQELRSSQALEPSVPCGTIHRGSDFVAIRKAMCKHSTIENMPKKKKIKTQKTPNQTTK